MESVKATVYSPGPIQLSRDEAKWVTAKWVQIRSAQALADAANNRWKDINASIKEKHDTEDNRRRARGDFPKTDLMRAQEKDASLPLKDALATGNWHSRNAERHIHDLNLFLRLKELGIL
jgi:hypothetical protein